MKDELTRAVAEAKVDRIRRERQPLLSRRKHVAKTLYETYKKAVGSEFGLLPSSEEFVGLKPINDIIDQDGTAEFTSTHFAGIDIGELVDEWRAPSISTLLNTIHSGGGPEPSDPPTASDIQRLSLAATFFQCRSRVSPAYGSISFEYIVKHPCCRPSTVQWWTKPRARDFSCLVYYHTSFLAAERLIHAAGRDPSVTTASEMDDLNLRFYCQGCPKGPDLARSWRNCVCTSEGFINSCLSLTAMFLSVC